MQRIHENPSEDEHDDERSDSLSEQTVLIFRRDSFQDPVLRQIVRPEENDDRHVETIIGILIRNS